MTLPFNRADSLREYLTGAASDGQNQDKGNLSIGNFRSSFEAFSLAIHLVNALDGVVVQAVTGKNGAGRGILLSPDGFSLAWQPPGDMAPGTPVAFPAGSSTVLILEGGNDAGKFVRVLGTPPFRADACTVNLTILLGNVFGFNIVPDANATAGISQYRATILRNESSGSSLQQVSRWVSELATPQVSNQGQLGGAGSGTIKVSNSFADWPTTGYCRVQQSGGTLREIVYYSARTSNVLTVPAAGRGLLGTSAGAGAATDTLHAVPGLAIGFDPAGPQSFGSAITVIANDTTPPGGVTWNTGITKATGLQLSQLSMGKQIGIWMWRQLPAGAVFAPNVYNELSTDFLAY